ncbi:MAG: NADH oxidase, partial [Cellvibrionaceae bacterium]|nr:NADH oxidase [Cellvibrionaceae bacterium]
MADTNLQLRSLVTDDNHLELSLVELPMPEPGADDIVVKMEASPLNPSDLALLFGPADLSTAVYSGTPERPQVRAEIPAGLAKLVKARVGQSLAVGNEGCGTVVAAGSSAAA